MKKLLFAAALAASLLVSCKEKNDLNDAEYATVTLGGKTWNKAEINTYSALIQSNEMTFNLRLIDDTQGTSTGSFTYYTSSDKIEFTIVGGYNSSMKDGILSVTQLDEKSYDLNISGTDIDGETVLIKGKAIKY